MKPDWKDAPKWAQYLAMDNDMQWNWFEYKPIQNGDYWITTEESRVKTALCETWNETLESRIKEQPVYIIAIDTLKTITKGYRYYSTKTVGGKVRIMDDVGTIRWMNKEHFKEWV